MLNRAVLKQSAREKLGGNWGPAVLMTLLFGLIGIGGEMIHHVGGLFGIFVTPALTLGWIYAFLTLVQSGSLRVEDLAGGFKRHYAKALGIYWWKALWILLWMLLFLVPGIIKSIAYSQAYYIIEEHPEVKVRDALKISMKMTEGHLWELFVLGLSFLGWVLLAVITVGIGFLWLAPYMTATYAAVYLELKKMSLESGACTEAMFSGQQRLVTD